MHCVVRLESVRSMSRQRALSVNSALAFASAELVTAALHEAGHGLAAQAFGFSPHIYAFYENNPSGNARETLTILAAGPLTSLLLGVIFWAWYRAAKPRYSYGRLLLLWLALIGVMELVNYLIVTPWLVGGDTARIADVLQWPTTARYGLTAIGVVLVVFLGRPAARAMLAVAPRSIAIESPEARRRFIMRSFYFPLLAGVILTALAGIGSRPLYVFYGLLGTVANIDIVSAARYANGLPPDDERRGTDATLRIEPVALVFYAALVLVYVLAFSRGVAV
jgi:hypothetical protein